MNTASEPYSTALLITTSISYSRYFSTATPIATHRHRNARFDSTAATTESVTIDGMNVATTSTAAAARMRTAASSSGLPPRLAGPNGSGQTPVACTTKTTPVKVNAPATNHAA